MIDESLIGVSINTAVLFSEEPKLKNLINIAMFYPVNKSGFWEKTDNSRMIEKHAYEPSLPFDCLMEILKQMKEQLIFELEGKGINIID